MYPTFTSTYILPTFSCYSNHNLSETPHSITLEDSTIFNEQLQQVNLLSDDHRNHITNDIAVHEQFASHETRASLQSARGKCSNNNGDDGFKNPKNISRRRRSSKKDRHSKINTARGPRDRRMRLSLDVAKKFFKLQDLLGFDKASNTVDWLLKKSKSNIQELIPLGKSSFSGASTSESFTSKRELLHENIEEEQNTKSSSRSSQKEKKKTSRGVRKSSYLFRPLAKETREMARKRARERTLEKSIIRNCVSGVDDGFSKFRSCFHQIMDPEMNHPVSRIINQPEQSISHLQLKQGFSDDNSSSMIRNWNPSFAFNYQHSVHPHEHQFNDFQILDDLWEANN